MDQWNPTSGDYWNTWGPAAIPKAAKNLTNSLFPNPADSAMPYYNQIAPTITPYYQPYINAGQSALPQVQSQYERMMYDPNEIISSIGSGYQQSPGYQWSYDQAMKGANNAAAAGGMLGTPQSQQQSAELATNLANQDFYNYLNHALGLYGQGVQGEQGINEMGFKASDTLAENLARALMSQGRLQYAGQAMSNKNTADLLGGATSMIKGLF